MTRKERLLNQITGKPVDHVPALGGWNLGVRNLAAIAGISVDEYMKDPLAGVVRANLALDVDAMVPPIVPTDLNAVRAISLQEKSFASVVPESLLERAENIPVDGGAVLSRFDPAAAEKTYRTHFDTFIPALRGIELITTCWEAPANFSLYFQYGYEAFLSAIGLYPDAIERIYWEDALIARERNRVLIRLMREYGVVPLLFTGHDICNGSGPMCSPAFLRKNYFPHMKTSLDPFIEAGIRVIGHCDGDVRPLIDDMIAAGMSGFQGFQYEFGVDPVEIDKRTSAQGEKLLYFMGLSVSRTLPFGSVRDVEAEVDYFMDVTGGRRMFLFTTNVTGVEVPPENVVAAYRHLRKQKPGKSARRKTPPVWPWGLTHPA